MRNRVVHLLVIGAAVLAACGTPTPSLTEPSDTAATPTIVPFESVEAITATPGIAAVTQTPEPTPAWLGSGCNPDDIVAALRPTVAYSQFSLSHNYLMTVYYLNAWFVDPGLDPLAEGDSLEQGVFLAQRHAALLAHQLNLGDACLARVFNQIIVTVVDGDYNTWFSGGIAPGDLPGNNQPSDAEIDQAIEAFAPGFVRSQPTASLGRAPAPAEACSWTQVRARMEERLGSGHNNAAFWYAIDDSGANVWGLWDGPADVDVFLPALTEVGLEMSCLYPAPDNFWVVYTDSVGFTQLVVTEPGDAIREGDLEAMVNQLQIVYPQSSQ